MVDSTRSNAMKRYWASAEAAGRRAKAEISDRVSLSVNNLAARIQSARGKNKRAAASIARANQAAFNINARRWARTQQSANKAVERGNLQRAATLRGKAAGIMTQTRLNSLQRDMANAVARRRTAAPPAGIARRPLPRPSALLSVRTFAVSNTVVSEASRSRARQSQNSFINKAYRYQGQGPLRAGINNLNLAQDNIRAIKARHSQSRFQSVVTSVTNSISANPIVRAIRQRRGN